MEVGWHASQATRSPFILPSSSGPFWLLTSVSGVWYPKGHLHRELSLASLTSRELRKVKLRMIYKLKWQRQAVWKVPGFIKFLSKNSVTDNSMRWLQDKVLTPNIARGKGHGGDKRAQPAGPPDCGGERYGGEGGSPTPASGVRRCRLPRLSPLALPPWRRGSQITGSRAGASSALPPSALPGETKVTPAKPGLWLVKPGVSPSRAVW